MTDTLLRSLRERLLDESEPLAGLLRKCLLLGAETGSETLRDWARKELNGYGDDDEVPDYRKVDGVSILMDSMSGNTWTQNQVFTRDQVPPDARKYVPEKLPFKQPIDELEQLAQQKRLSFKSRGLAIAQTVWNQQLGPYQSIVGLSYTLSGTAFVGVLGQIRTKLVEIIADLTADTPLSELPKKDQVDAAVSHRIGGDVYNTTIQTTNGTVAIGAKAKASTEGMTLDEALRLLDKVQQAAADVANPQRAELLDALGELRDAAKNDKPDTGDVVKKVGKLRDIANKLGVPSVAGAVGGAAQAFTELALTGAFG